MRHVKILLASFALVAMLGTTPERAVHKTGSFRLEVGNGPYISGSRILVDASGVQGSFSLSVLGPGSVEGHEYVAPAIEQPVNATLIGAARGAVAYSTVRVVPAPQPHRPLLAVASYESGIALHDPQTFALIGYVPIGGPPGDVAFADDGSILVPDTDGNTLTVISRDPWQVRRITGISEGNEIAVDRHSGDIFVSDRDAGPSGALTRVSPNGAVTLVPTGATAEGLAIDERRDLVYVGNVNERSVAVVDARTMRVVRKLPSVDRTFGIALDPAGQRLFVVSNDSPGMNTHGGYVAIIDAGSAFPHIAAKSAYFTFPLGVALDSARKRLFVTDEAKDVLYVLNSETLAPLRKPLATCHTPWRPRIVGDRLFVPCARADRVDVIDLATLRHVKGAPFATGGFPLSVSLWP